MRITSDIKQIQRMFTLALIAVLLIPIFMANIVYATSVDVLEGDINISDNQNTGSYASTSNEYTATVTSSILTRKTNTLTITNNTSSKATIQFDYSVSNIDTSETGAFKIDGADYDSTTTGTFSKVLDAGKEFELSFRAPRGFGNRTATLTLSNFSLTIASDSSNVTIAYDNTLGGVTAGGSAIAPGDTKDGVTLTDGIALVATANSGTNFLGWVDAANGLVLSTSTSFTLKPSADMTVKAAFAKDGDTPWFGVGGTVAKTWSSGFLNMTTNTYYTVSVAYLFDNLADAAATAASSSSNKAIVLMNSGTLAAGDYTIPAGVTLLIPFDSDNTMYTTAAQYTDTNSSWQQPTAYRTLTMASGAKITVNGAISISAKHRCVQGSSAKNKWGGAPTGAVGFINMEGTSSIEVNDGGALYAYGFITGSGGVTARSGATIYEVFQITDYRGGDQSTAMENDVFPVSQYYVQNIEVPLTLYSGAKEYGYTTVNASGSYFGSSSNFIGVSGAMFNITSGYVVKEYNGTTDRLLIDVNGAVSLSSIEIILAANQGINSAKYVLALNGNITITIKAGKSVIVNQDIAMIPGSELVIEETATVTLAEGKSVYIYDSSSWGDNYRHGEGVYAKVWYAPGRTGDGSATELVDASILVNGTLDVSKGYVYTTNSIIDGDTDGGANIHSTGSGQVILTAGTETVTYQCVNNSTYQSIPIDSAKLKNGDGTYALTANSGTSPNTYTYVDGFWRCATHTWENYTCTVCGCPLFTIDAANVVLGNNLDMLFAFTYHGTDTLTTESGYYIKLQRDFADTEKTDEVAYQIGDWTPLKDSDGNVIANRYYITYSDLAAKEMCDTITLAVYDADNNRVSNIWTDSMRDYAMRMLDNCGEDSKDAKAPYIRALVVDMLNYGAAAQERFEYNKSDLANKELTTTQKGYATSEVKNTAVESTLGDKCVASNLVTTSNIQFLLAFDGIDSNSMYATIEFTDHYGNKREEKITTWGKTGSYYYLTIETLVVADAWQPVTVTVYNSDGSIYATCVESIAGYLARCADNNALNAVSGAYLKFAQSAWYYFRYLEDVSAG